MADERRPHPVTGRLFPSPVPPGSGWPGDPATRRTPVAADDADVRRLAASARTMNQLDARVSVCRACPRLVEWREDVARTGRRASFADQPYWGRPIPGYGDPAPRLLVVGLAPAANGGNRTGRTFTGDRSGDWIFAALHRAGYAAVPWSRDAADGQQLHGARIVAAVRCAPPANKPTPDEVATCGHWLDRELELSAPSVRVLLALGSIAWDAALAALRRAGGAHERPRPRFGHGARAALAVPERWQRAGAAPVWTLLGSYHVSQQNTFTGRLTEPMLDDVLAQARELSG